MRLLTLSSESKALTTGAKGKKFQAKAWEEIIDVLEKETPGVKAILPKA